MVSYGEVERGMIEYDRRSSDIINVIRMRFERLMGQKWDDGKQSGRQRGVDGTASHVRDRGDWEASERDANGTASERQVGNYWDIYQESSNGK